MDNYSHDEPMLKLECRLCWHQFYWEATYNGVGCLTKCPKCSNNRSQQFTILQRIVNGTKA